MVLPCKRYGFASGVRRCWYGNMQRSEFKRFILMLRKWWRWDEMERRAGCGMVCVMGQILNGKAEMDSCVGCGVACMMDGDCP